MRVNSQLLWAMPLQLVTTPPPGHRPVTVDRPERQPAEAVLLAQSRIGVQVAGRGHLLLVDRPFMPEMPMWAYACASVQPNADLSSFFRPSAALTVSL